MLLITVDPERDTPEVLKQYVTAFDPRFLGLTGTPDPVKKAAASFKAYYAKAPTKDGNYTMDHTAAFYLLDGKGESRVLANNNIGVDALVHDIQALLRADAAAAVGQPASRAGIGRRCRAIGCTAYDVIRRLRPASGPAHRAPCRRYPPWAVRGGAT